MKTNVGILIFDDAEVLDFAGPFEVFSVTESAPDTKCFNVFTISHCSGSIRAVNGLNVLPDYTIDEHPPIDILILSGGVEYWYNDLFAVRGGFFYENPHKGNRKYFTLGFGIRYQVFGLDFAYLVPVRSNNPLAETLRFTLHFNFESKSQRDIETITD